MKPAEIEVKINLARREMELWQGILADKRCSNCTEWGDVQQVSSQAAGRSQGDWLR